MEHRCVHRIAQNYNLKGLVFVRNDADTRGSDTLSSPTIQTHSRWSPPLLPKSRHPHNRPLYR